MGGTGANDPRIPAAKSRVAEAKKKVDSIKNSIKNGIKVPKEEVKKALKEYEEAVKALENLLGSELNPPPPPRAGSSVGDPHFVGFDGEYYDVMPDGSAIIFAASTPTPKQNRYTFNKPEKHFCVTGIHSALLGSPNQPSNGAPTWTVSVFIKIYENTLFYDRDQTLLLNGMEASPCGVFSCSDDEQASPGYYFLDDERTELEVWHPIFGRVVVHNSWNHNLNLSFSVPEEIFKHSEIEGMMVGKTKTNVWQQPNKSIDEKKFNEMKAKNPDLSEQLLRDLVFDYQYTSPEIREKVLESNIVSVEKQKKIFEQDKCSVNLNLSQWKAIFERGLISSLGTGHQCIHTGSYKGPQAKYRITVSRSTGHPDLYITSDLNNHPVPHLSTSSSWSRGDKSSTVAIYTCAGSGATYDYDHSGGDFYVWIRNYGDDAITNLSVSVTKL